MNRFRSFFCSTLAVAAFAVPTAQADTITIQSGEDTAPYSFVPTLARYNNPTLYAFDAEDENMLQHAFETYIRFDLPPGTIPSGHIVDSATFFITYAFDFTGFGDTSTDPGAVDLHQVTQSWDQTTLTWLNRPTIGPVIGTVSNITGFGPLIYDVTDLVTDWTTGTSPNNGLVLTSVTERVIGMHSFEASEPASLKANLVIETVEVVEVPGLQTAGLIVLGLALGSLALFEIRPRRSIDGV